MRTISIYRYDELSDEAKKKAIDEVREEMERNEWPESYGWAIDDCSLFEPPHSEMVKCCGDNYYEENRTPDGRNGQFVFQNSRKGIEFDYEDSDIINVQEAMSITNKRMFKLWMGIPEMFHNTVGYEIHTYSTTTTIRLFHDELQGEIMGDVLNGILESAKVKFDSHISSIHSRISKGMDEYFEDDNVEFRIEDGNYEFREDGSIWNS
jgi:hypothetical protein